MVRRAPAPASRMNRLRRLPTTVLAAMTMLMASATAHRHFDCPLAQHLSPCRCVERSRGLDVSCADLSSMQLREVLDVLALTRQTLWFLRLERADLAHFPERLLEGLDVRNLVVARCNVSALDPNAFRGEASRVESLDLARNALGWVPTRALSALGSLAALSLDHNAIEALEAHAFRNLESLLWLSLYGNRIRTIDSRAFAGTEASLTRLNLGGNRLGQVPRYALQRLRCLQGLRLHENNVTEVLVENLPTSLCDLDLSGNAIVELEVDAFATLTHLSALDLEDNRIRTIHDEAFRGIYDSLEWLKLGGNEIASIPHVALRNLSRLRQLDLRCNHIRHVGVEAFADYGRTLKFIFLQKNSIQRIESGALDILESAEWLYLHSNELTSLSSDTLKPVIDNLHVIDLHDNPFHCNCDMLWFRDWLLAKGQNVANLPKETRCQSPQEHAQEPIVKLANATFVCSGATCISTNSNAIVLLMLLLSIFVFFKYS